MNWTQVCLASKSEHLTLSQATPSACGKLRRKSDFCGHLGGGGGSGVAAPDLLFQHLHQEEALEGPASARGRGFWTLRGAGEGSRALPWLSPGRPGSDRLETQNGNGLVLLCQHQYRRSHKFLTNPTMSEPHGALETSQKFWGSVAGWFWLRIPHVAVVRRHLGCTHLKARLGLEHLPSRYFTHMAAGNQKKPGGTFDILPGNLLC
ncbi:uncharacterized protein [Equus asinus]|uniref:uncharacterized protein isoform X3 n=1 Tax=Equus asinus TaxID=9793 RepID=UPI0038F7CB40